MDLASHTTIDLCWRSDVMATLHTNISGQRPPSGMERFFSSANLDRYRKLATSRVAAIAEAEQRKLLKDLAEEMNAFRRDARGAANRTPVPHEDIGPQAGSRI
jgi:hypothetical protein